LGKLVERNTNCPMCRADFSASAPATALNNIVGDAFAKSALPTDVIHECRKRKREWHGEVEKKRAKVQKKLLGLEKERTRAIESAESSLAKYSMMPFSPSSLSALLESIKDKTESEQVQKLDTLVEDSHRIGRYLNEQAEPAYDAVGSMDYIVKLNKQIAEVKTELATFPFA
jgi:hypothetical protein